MNKTLLAKYPEGIASRALHPGGSSILAKQYLESATHMRVHGRVNRFSKDRVKIQDDPYFAEFVRESLGTSPSNLFTKYGLAQPNKAAGYKSLLKYDKDQPTLRRSKWALAGAWTERHFACMNNAEVWTDHNEVKKCLDMKTSSGFPWNCDPDLKTKGQFYNHPESMNYCQDYWECLKESQCAPVFWTNNVKEELRDAEKIALNKLRTFVGAPVQHVHACTQMFGDMNNKFYETANTGQHWSFVGSTKFFRGWNKLFRRLSKHPNAFELDESEYDSSLFREAMYGMAEFRFRMLAPEHQTEENRNRIWNLYVEIVDSVIVTQDGDVVSKDTGNPSGSANTIVDNTVILFRLKAYAWLCLCEDLEPDFRAKYETYGAFMDNVEAALTGDDNTWTCSDDVVGWYNALNVSKIWSGIGVTTKYGNSSAPRKLEDCTFLSMGFRKLGDQYVPIPEGEKMMCSMAYHLKSATPRWSLLRACALRVETFWDDASRKLLSEYIHWLNKQYVAELHSPNDENDILDRFTYQDVWSVYKTDSEIRQLYLSEEGSSWLTGFSVLDKLLYSYVGLCTTGKERQVPQGISPHNLKMTKTKSQKARMRAKATGAAKAHGGKRAPKARGQKRRGRARGRGRQRGSQGLGMPNQKVNTAPASVGINYGASMITRKAGKVQAHADQDPSAGSERVSFCDMFSTIVQAGSVTATGGFGGTATYFKNLSPSQLSPRLTQLEELYEYYAFRRLKIEYLPIVGTATNVAVNLGIDSNVASDANFATPVPQQVLEFRPSMGGIAWQVMEMEYKHTGSKLWACTTVGESDVSNYAQCVLYCVLDGSPATSVGYGKLRISGIIDFYKDTPPSATNPALVLSRNLNFHSGPALVEHVKRCKAYMDLLSDEKVDPKDVGVYNDGIYLKGIRVYPDVKDYDGTNHDPRALEKQVAQLTRLVTQLMVKTEDEEKDIEVLEDIQNLKGPARPNRTSDLPVIVGHDYGIPVTSSRQSTPNKTKAGWFAGSS